MQVSAGSLQLLLALPALVELKAWAFLDDLHKTQQHAERALRKDTLRAGLEGLQASFRSSGRSLIVSDVAADE